MATCSPSPPPAVALEGGWGDRRVDQKAVFWGSPLRVPAHPPFAVTAQLLEVEFGGVNALLAPTPASPPAVSSSATQKSPPGAGFFSAPKSQVCTMA